ncbi:spore coat protein [Oceanobacillus caeni]|uniref:Spore coat protein n=1 Tax=Oceanobacillus caeni TaxID=405946 RepID=A0ABR5MGB8_9BACI|nr:MULTISPECIES: spore coat protein [Bacillaceae]KKE79964.1 spore coat protein [Bacilli bacterium VT-13-104]PZD83000.1 spore coat protein [Bacilli bacterium]KPH71576.1 spore coat protein [Oceanobacillus caeni]MBU8792426.1 spore coat protein [Oceanobacillus caeni]MCR1835333.1 spore coat protein [Oceanobacillus caeni]
MEMSNNIRPNHLAWHETLEVHELVVFQSISLMKLKRFIKEVRDSELKSIYEHVIKGLETNLKELLEFYALAPTEELRDRNLDDGFFSGDLLAFAKTSVRNYSNAITETATPILRQTLNKQLQRSIQTHEMVFNYMYKNGYYPAYDLEKLLKHDVQLANKALKMK